MALRKRFFKIIEARLSLWPGSALEGFQDGAFPKTLGSVSKRLTTTCSAAMIAMSDRSSTRGHIGICRPHPSRDTFSLVVATLHHVTGSAREIGIVVVGAQKSFSTTIAKVLGQHPQIDMASGEFHGFLDGPYAAGSARRLHDLFRDDSAPVKAFKCASYLADPHVPQRLHDDLGAPHIVACLRNPIERAQSAWYWLIRTGLLPVIGADEGLRWLMEHEEPPPRYTAFEWRHAREVLDWGLYDLHLQRYAECFKPERLHVITDLDFMPENTDAVMASLIAALGLPPFTPTAQRHRSNEGVYSLTRLRWLSTRQRFVWNLGDDGVWTQGTPHVWWKWLANAAVVGTDRLILSHLLPNEAPALSPHTHQLLVEYYADDVRRLESRLGQDLGAWLA